MQVDRFIEEVILQAQVHVGLVGLDDTYWHHHFFPFLRSIMA